MDIWGLVASIAISFSASFLFAYILYWLDLYEKEPLILLGVVFTWGVIVAAGGAFIINTVIGISVFVVTGSETASSLTTSAVTAPVIEEFLKGFAVVLVFLIFRREFNSVLDGIVYAGVTALGFSATENAYYIFTYGFLEEGWQGFRTLALIRLGLVGWQHPFYTAFVGIGLATARLNKSVIIKLVAPALGFGAAISAHALHNILASFFVGPGGMVFTTALDWIGWVIMLGFIFIAMLVERQKITKYLAPEVDDGILTQSQFTIAQSFTRISLHRIKSIFAGSYFKTTRFYRNAAEYALKKDLQIRLGENNAEDLEKLRNEIHVLSKELT